MLMSREKSINPWAGRVHAGNHSDYGDSNISAAGGGGHTALSSPSPLPRGSAGVQALQLCIFQYSAWTFTGNFIPYPPDFKETWNFSQILPAPEKSQSPLTSLILTGITLGH